MRAAAKDTMGDHAAIRTRTDHADPIWSHGGTVTLPRGPVVYVLDRNNKLRSVNRERCQPVPPDADMTEVAQKLTKAQKVNNTLRHSKAQGRQRVLGARTSTWHRTTGNGGLERIVLRPERDTQHANPIPLPQPRAIGHGVMRRHGT